MGKLSQEAWTIAFYEVMKERVPTSKDSLKRIGTQLAQQEGVAQQELKAAKDKATLATNIAEDAENKRFGAGVDLDRSRSTTLTAEGRKSAQDDYDRAEQRARETAGTAKQARIEHKEAAFKVKQLQDQMAEIDRRMKTGDLDGLSDELNAALQQAQLASRLDSENNIIADLQERLRLREDELASAQRNLETGKAFILEGDVAGFKERIQNASARRDAITALQPGFELKTAEPKNANDLAETADRMKAAAGASDEAVALQQNRLQEKQGVVTGKDGELEAAAARDPALQKAVEALAAKRAAQTQAEAQLADNKASLQRSDRDYQQWQKTLDAYASGADPQPKARDVDDALLATDNRVKSLARDKVDLRGSQDTLRKAAAEVQAAKAALTEAIAARAKAKPPNPELASAVAALEAAEADARRVEAALAQSKQESGRVHALADEAKRRLTVAQALPEATATVGQFNGALKGVEDTPIWDGSEQLQKKLGDKKFKELQQLGNKFINEYEKLSANGATMEELQALFKDTPDLWKPPRFREEEQNWVAMKDLVDEEAEDKYRKESETRLSAVDKKIAAFKGKLKTGETVGSVLVSGMGQAKTHGDMLPGETLKAMAKALAEHKELAELAENVLSLAGQLASVVKAPIKGMDALSKSMETEDPVEMLMLQDEFMASLSELVSGLTGSIKGADKLKIGGEMVQQMASLLPGIGVAVSAAEAMKGMVESAARIQEALDDADAHAEAEDSGHRGEGAIGQFARRDKHLAARAVTSTGVAMVKTAAAAVDLTGVGVAASTAMKGVATGVSAIQGVAEVVIDRTEGEKAQALLDAAQAGDGHARAELFSFHPRYAKGILAIMASEGDALALRVLSTHGLSEDMIKRSSPKIIKRYLLKKFGESDTPPSWSSAKDAIVSVLNSVGDKLQAIDDFFGNVADKLLASLDPNKLVAAQASLSDLAYQLPAQDVSTAVTSLVEVRNRRQTLAASATPEQSEDLEALDLALDKELKGVEKVRTRVLDSMKKVRVVIEQIGEQPKNALRDKAEAAAKVVLREHLARVQELAIAA